MTTSELQNKYYKEQGMDCIDSNGDFTIDYVEWLQSKLIQPEPKEESEVELWDELRNMFYYLENNGDKDTALFNEIKSKFTIKRK